MKTIRLFVFALSLSGGFLPAFGENASVFAYQGRPHEGGHPALRFHLQAV